MADQRAHHNKASVGGRGAIGLPGFEQLSVIGTGGSATVYRAYDVRHQRWVALKVVDGQATDDRQRRTFDREIQALGRIGSHPYIVTALASGFTPDNHPYLVLPLFERGTFAELVDENGPFTWARAIDIGIKLCSAVETVHRAGVVHRDIKPGNVFVGVSPAQPLLGDFGISSMVGSERTKTSTMAVTFGYTAPEVLDDERPTVASDIYSLGMTVYRLVQGLPAYHADTPAAVMRKVLDTAQQPRLSAGVPARLAEIVVAMLATDPVDRPESALTVARRLQQVQVESGLATTEVLVADEPPTVARPAPSTRDSGHSGKGPTTSTDGVAPAVADAMMAPSSGPAPEPTSPGSTVAASAGHTRSTADRVGSALAAALAESSPRVGSSGGSSNRTNTPPYQSRPGHEPESSAVAPAPSHSNEVPDRPSLDLPTSHEPRAPRQVRQRQQPEPVASSRATFTVVAAPALVVVFVALYVLVAFGQGWWPF